VPTTQLAVTTHRIETRYAVSGPLIQEEALGTSYRYSRGDATVTLTFPRDPRDFYEPRESEKPVWHVLEAEDGYELLLCNPRHVKNLPGHKTDVSDAAWPDPRGRLPGRDYGRRAGRDPRGAHRGRGHHAEHAGRQRPSHR
jgi:hypothetical protein